MGLPPLLAVAPAGRERQPSASARWSTASAGAPGWPGSASFGAWLPGATRLRAGLPGLPGQPG